MRGCPLSRAAAPPRAFPAPSLPWTSALALAVITQALRDARSPALPGAIRDEARNFLVASDRLVLWAELLDVDLETVRASACRALRVEAPGRVPRPPVRRGPPSPPQEAPTSSPAPVEPLKDGTGADTVFSRPRREWILSEFQTPGILSDNPLSID